MAAVCQKLKCRITIYFCETFSTEMASAWV